MPTGEQLAEVIDEQRDVGRAVAKRRHVQVQHIQPVIQILAELAGTDCFEQAAIGRRDDAHVDDPVRPAAD